MSREMSYSPEQVQEVCDRAFYEMSHEQATKVCGMLTAYAATLRQQAARVDDLLPLAIKGWNEHQQRCRITTVEGSLRAALEAALSAQPAQAVDVGALQKVADDLACVARLTDHDLTRGTCQSASDRITRALAGEKAEGWRDIATAPKDGTRVLVAYSIDGAGEIDGAMWCEPDQVWMLSDGFLCVGESEPTHWMPLPTPPTPDKEG